MASPHVTGCVALKPFVSPALTPTQIKAALQSTATNLGLPATRQGTGLVNGNALVRAS